MRKRKHPNKRYRWPNVLLLLLVLTTACARPAEAPVPDIGTLQVGYIPTLGFAPLFIALEKGYFEEQGLEVELLSFRSGTPMIAPLSTGDLDVGGGETGTALFNAIGQGLDVKVVAALAAQPPGYGAVPLLVQKDLLDSGEIVEVANLRGRKIAVNVERGMAEYLLSEALAGVGLTVDDVEMVTLPFPEMPAALANQAIDAGVLPHPLAARAIGDGSAAVLLEGDAIVDTPQNGVIYFGQQLTSPANREVGIRFLIAYLKGARDLYGEGWRSEENVAIISAYTNVPAEAIQKGIAYYFDPNGEINLSSTEKIQAYFFGRGYTELSQPLPLAQVIDETYLVEAIERLGRFEQ